MRRITAVLAAVMLMGFAQIAFGTANPDAEMALDARPHDPARQCGATYVDCGEIQYQYAGTGEYDILVVLYNFNQLTAVEYSLDFTGIQDAEYISFQSCSTLDLRWEYPGIYSTAQAWGTCQAPPAGPGSGIVAGWIRLLGGAGTITIEPEVGSGLLRVVDCAFEPDFVHATHAAFVGGAQPGPGYLAPCGTPTANEETTWGGVKSLYR